MKKFLLIGLLLFGTALAHEGHHHHAMDEPQAKFGGFLEKAEHEHHSSKHHDHGVASQRSIYFELVYKPDHYQLYIWNKEKGQSLELKPLTANGGISRVQAKQKNPRIRKEKGTQLKVVESGGHWLLSPAKIQGKRAFVDVSVLYGGESWKARVQVERP